MSTASNGLGAGPRPAIDVVGLAKTYPGGVEAVKGIDFSVIPGEVFGLLGPNIRPVAGSHQALSSFGPHQSVARFRE
jgi:ABC-type phosphonate transport system ATPase subunit